MGRHNRMRETRSPVDRMDTAAEPPGKDMQIRDPGDPLSLSPIHDITQPSSSSYSSSGTSGGTSKKLEKKKLVQQCLNELRQFLRPQQKSTTLETLNQLLELLKNIYPNPDRELPPRLLLSNNSHHSTGFITDDDDKELLNNKFGVKFELSQPDGVILNVCFNTLHPLLSWIDNYSELYGKLFADLIDTDDGQLYFLQQFSIRVSDERHGFIKTKNPILNVESCHTSSSVPCKYFATSVMSQDGRKRLHLTLIPLATIYSSGSKFMSQTFFTKHSTDCRFIDVDNKIVSFWGYLPEEILGQSFLSFITDDSCEAFEASHEQAAKARGKMVRSNAYQFIIRSGKSITMQTEWSLFVNPWTKRVDFVMGCHCVLDGSQRHGMFDNSDNDRVIKTSEKAQLVQRKITKLLSQPFAQKLKTKPVNAMQNVSKTQKSDSSKTTDKQPAEPLKVDDKEGTSCRHMSTLYDLMIEHVYYMSNAPSLPEDVVKKGSPQESLLASGDGSSGSPPESSGSGPSYNEITRLENVTRLLKSQEGQSSDESSGEKCAKSSSCSPVETNQVDGDAPTSAQLDQPANSAILEALYNNNPAQINMHRSQSAAADLDHCRQSAVVLTSEILQTFTKEQERQYKANWKRRFSVELQHVALKRALDPAVVDHSNSCNSQKISRPEVYRPASMPVIAKSNEPYFYNPLTSPVSTWNNPLNPSAVPPVKSNSGNYYRSLGPTPAPPPGKNFQITSAPLPAEGFTVVPEPLSPRQSAFAPLKRPLDNLYSTPNENWNSASSAVQPINLSLRSEVPFQTSVIQSSSDGSRPHWLSVPGASASVTLQRMTQTSRLMRETQWPVPNQPRPLPMSEDLLFRYQYNSPSTLQDVFQNDQNRRIYNENQSLVSTLDVSPIREATESLMLLEEI